MAFSLLFLLAFFSLTPLSTSQITQNFTPKDSIFLPIFKHAITNQFLTRINNGAQMVLATLVVDLGSPFLFMDCSAARSASQRTILRRAIQCAAAAPPDSAAEGCTLLAYNPITGASEMGELVEDILAVDHLGDPYLAVDQFLLLCTAPFLLRGLAYQAQGVMGLGSGRVGVPSQIAYKFGYPQKFSICLPSSLNSNGLILFGESSDISDFYKSLMYTPLVNNPSNEGPIEDYHINVKSIMINNKKLAIENWSTSSLARISTVAPYTMMETSVFESFIRGFDSASEAVNLTKATAVAPFNACYEVDGGGTVALPVVDLVLQSEMVKWRIHGENLMVKVGDGLMCLGFLDGGLKLGVSIVIGSRQLEDNLLEFDLGNSKLGFSSSLLMKGTSCGDLGLGVMGKNHGSF